MTKLLLRIVSVFVILSLSMEDVAALGCLVPRQCSSFSHQTTLPWPGNQALALRLQAMAHVIPDNDSTRIGLSGIHLRRAAILLERNSQETQTLLNKTVITVRNQFPWLEDKIPGLMISAPLAEECRLFMDAVLYLSGSFESTRRSDSPRTRLKRMKNWLRQWPAFFENCLRLAAAISAQPFEFHGSTTATFSMAEASRALTRVSEEIASWTRLATRPESEWPLAKLFRAYHGGKIKPSDAELLRLSGFFSLWREADESASMDGQRPIEYGLFRLALLEMEKLGISSSDRWVDLGVAVGNTLVYAASVLPAGSFFGLDNVPERVRAAEKAIAASGLPNMSVVVQNMLTEPLPDGTLYYLFNPIQPEDYPRLLQSLRAIGHPFWVIALGSIMHAFSEPKSGFELAVMLQKNLAIGGIFRYTGGETTAKVQLQILEQDA